MAGWYFHQRLCGVSSSNPAAGRNGQDARTIGRMDAIRNIKTMAGSLDAETAKLRDQRLAILRMVFSFRRPCFREPMKDA
jgi:hypothetical protein